MMNRLKRISESELSQIETLDCAKLQTHLATPSSGTEDHTYDNLPALNSNSKHSSSSHNSNSSHNSMASPRPPICPPAPGSSAYSQFRRRSSSVFASDVEKIRASLVAKHSLYLDPEFPADDRALYFSRAPAQAIVWKRPHEILRDKKSSERPRLFVSTPQCFDLVQGALGDCWVVAALAFIAEVPELVRRVVPMGQTFEAPWYAGMFLFRFWRFGRTVDVLVDDRLPTHNNELLFVHSRCENEFWGALVEKAYAKLVGSYEALKAGVLRDALTDFTGGVTECYSLDRPSALPPKIINIIFKAFERQSLIGAGIKDRQLNATSPRMEHGRILNNGLISGHAYTLTDIRRIRMSGINGVMTEVTLVRVRNPWGKRVAWNGSWSDTSMEWKNVPEADRKATGIVVRDEAEFWMTWDDFVDEFDVLDLCHLQGGSLTEAPPADLQVPQWRCFELSGRWRRAVSSGGRPFCRQSHWTNPQFLIHLPDPDEDEEEMSTLIICLMQKDTRKLRHLGAQLLAVGFAVYRLLPEYDMPLPKSFFDSHSYVVACDYFINSRDVVKRFQMEPGDYVVIPSTYEMGQEGDFLLRIFVESNRASATMIEEETTSASPVAVQEDPDLDQRIEKLRHTFYTIAGESMCLDAFQLHRLFRQIGDRDPYLGSLNIGACKSLISMAEEEEEGGTLKMAFREMISIWNQIYTWRQTFHRYDGEVKGSIDVSQLRSILSENVNFRNRQREGNISLGLEQLLEITLAT